MGFMMILGSFVEEHGNKKITIASFRELEKLDVKFRSVLEAREHLSIVYQKQTYGPFWNWNICYNYFQKKKELEVSKRLRELEYKTREVREQ